VGYGQKQIGWLWCLFLSQQMGLLMARSLKEYLVWMLSRREYSRQELATKSRFKFPDLSSDEIEGHLDNLSDQGWQSDARFCRSFFRMRTEQGKGLRLIRQELAFKGISQHLIEDVILEFDVDWQAIATRQILKKYRSADLSDTQVKHKIYQFLTRKGFTGREIEQSLQDLRCD